MNVFKGTFKECFALLRQMNVHSFAFNGKKV